MNVPTSTASRAPISRVNMVMNAPCSGEICMIEMPPSSWVSSIRACWISSIGVLCPIMYSWISGLRLKDLGSAMAARPSTGFTSPRWPRSWQRRENDAHTVADIVSSTFLAAIHGSSTFDRGRSPITARFWLLAIARNEIAKHHGKVGRQQVLWQRERSTRQLSEDETARIDELIDAQRLAPDIQAALDELSPAVRDAFVLVAVDGVPQAAAAGVLGISHVALRARLTRRGSTSDVGSRAMPFTSSIPRPS